jgi:hypothetical protein
MGQVERVEHLEQITSSRGANIHALTVSAPMSYVLQADYWNRWSEQGLRRHDKVLVTAAFTSPVAEHAWFVILSNDKGKVAARLWLTGSDAKL